MRVFAPGKLVLTGPYAVLYGAPALVVATSRGVVASGDALADSPSPEVSAAGIAAPRVDVSQLFDGGRKLGLGASAAILVASLGLRAAERGEDLGDSSVRARVFAAARAAHAAAQGGGSGVDVAAAVYGGALLYTIRDGSPGIAEVALPSGASVHVFAARTSARTSDLRARVDALRARDAAGFGHVLAPLVAAAEAGARAVERGDAEALLAAGRATGDALAELGRAADAPIVPPSFADLARAAADEGAAFFGSGAGGGDVGVYLATHPPSRAFLGRAATLELDFLDVTLDSGTRRGVQTLN